MQVAKWGNSLAVRLPRKLVERLGLKLGDEISVIDAAEAQLVVAKVDAKEGALRRMANRGWSRPSDVQFDRDEANAR